MGVELSNLDRIVHDLVRKAAIGGILTVEEQAGSRFVQFLVAEQNPPVLELGFPRAQWSAQYWEDVRRTLTQEGVRYEVEGVAETQEGDVDRFMIARGLDPDTVVELAKKLMVTMGLQGAEMVRVSLDGALIEGGYRAGRRAAEAAIKEQMDR